jgi:foldase protein PrsA
MAMAVISGACAGGADDAVVAHVGHAAITKATVKRWMSALAGGRIPSDASGRQSLRAQALDFLISSRWLLGEVAMDGIELTPPEVQRQLEQKRRTSFPGGDAELREFLKASGQSVSDITFEAKAELASARIRKALADREPPITPAQVVGYYSRHRQRFTIPERRDVILTNRKSAAEAQALRREVQAGRSFAGAARREWIALPPIAYSARRGNDAALPRAIHLARAGVLSGPVLVHGVDYYIFKVMRITPARLQALAQVKGSIRRQLAAERQRRTLVAFVRAWRRRWIARTSCAPGYVVQKCRQFRGVRAPEELATLS